MKIAVSADWHLDARTAGIERAEELDAYVEALVDRLRTGEFDAFIHAGDYFDPGTLSESRWTTTLMRHVAVIHAHVGTSIWITGNHDVVETGAGWSTLSPLGEAARHGWCCGMKERIGIEIEPPNICELPQTIDIQTGDVCVLALPFVSRATERTPVYVEMLERELKNARELKARGRKLVVVGHFSIPGIVPGSEEEMQRGREMVFPAETIAALKPDLVLQGHYHKRQTVVCGGVVVEIIGAPLRMTFGEDDGHRGWLEIEL